MALGGGTFVVQNKDLPGAYINFVSAASANPALSDRGIATMPLELDWGADDAVFSVTNEDFQKNSRKIFGYDYKSEKLKGLRDLFRNAQTLYAYKLTSGGKKASCVGGGLSVTAKYGGIRGNDLSFSVLENPDKGFDVQVRLENDVVSEYIGVTNAEDLFNVNDDYVVFVSPVSDNPAENVIKTEMPSDEDDLYNLRVNDLQSGISFAVDGNTAYVSGQLNYIKDYKGFSSIEAEQNGNFFAVKLSEEDLAVDYDTITIIKNGEEIKKD